MTERLQVATVKSMKIQLSGCDPCTKTATKSPLGRIQNSAAPLKNKSLVHSKDPMLLSEKVVTIFPGVTDGANIEYGAPVDDENCAVVPLAYCTKSWP